LLPGPFKIIQTPELILIRNEYENTFRQIYTDGRKPPGDPEPLWLGYSVGRWDGDTLQVDTVGFNDKSWLDGLGHPHRDALHVPERFRRRDFGHLDVQVTIDDPKVYTSHSRLSSLSCCFRIVMFWSISALKTKGTDPT
jgi:hypothetical protein